MTRALLEIFQNGIDPNIQQLSNRKCNCAMCPPWDLTEDKKTNEEVQFRLLKDTVATMKL